MKTLPIRIHVILLSVILLAGCSKEGTSQNLPISVFAKGTDISWLPQMEATGYKFYSDNGVEEDCFKILKGHGINSIRLRTFVNPSDDKASGHCSKEETVAIAVRAQKWGMKVMINFHYSDTWADPGHQKKPKAWEGHDFPTYPFWLEGKPDYTLSVDDLGKNLNDMVSRYGKEVMVVEVGGEDNKVQNTYDMLIAVLKKVKEVPNGKGLGVFYWEPQGARSWSHYGLCAWGDDGKPTKAMDAFLEE